MDLEAEYDKNNQLIGIKECSEEIYDMHTKKHDNFGTASMFAGTAMETGNRTDEAGLLKDYERYGVTYHSERGAWFYNNQQIEVFIDYEKSFVYSDDKGSLYLVLTKNSENELEAREISLESAQAILQSNNPDSFNSITTKEK